MIHECKGSSGGGKSFSIKLVGGKSSKREQEEGT